MKKLLFLSVVFLSLQTYSQITPLALPAPGVKRCNTMDAMNEAIRKNPGILEEWRKNGEKQYRKFLDRSAAGRGSLADTIIIPIVFHLVDEAPKLAWITDRSIYDQVEMLNEAFNGIKVEKYRNVIPPEIYARKGEIPIRFVLARRDPAGNLTSGIERKVATTPDRIKIKSATEGGLDAWDTDKYLNVWAGSFSGDDDDLLGVATFPFTTSEGAQGVVINLISLPYTSNVTRSYFPIYSEGVTLIHELGHYFYLWHTFGDLSYCNNEDFRIQPGWPLPTGAGPEGDDTPREKQDNNTLFGNPSMNFSDGCETGTMGEMYGNFLNYFDDRALFMFSNGQRKRVEGCIQLYRQGLAGSIGATAPGSVTDAYVVRVSPYGSPERKTHIMNNAPLTAVVRNYGTTVINTVTLNVKTDNTLSFQQTFAINLAPGQDIELNLGNINSADGNRIITVYTSNPNGGTDQFNANDTLQSFVSITSSTINTPYTEDFNGSIFPPAGWKIWNPNNDGTWVKNNESGFPEAGSATMQFRSFSGAGQLDELVMPAMNLGNPDSAELAFRYAYAVYNKNNVATWDGLEVYISNDMGRSYQLAFKKTGDFLKTINSSQTTSFQALPTNPEKWVLQKINLTPFLNGKPLLIKFRAVNAKGNNLYIDDVKVTPISIFNREVEAISLTDIPKYVCGEIPSPLFTFRNNGKDILENVTINYRINSGSVVQQTWTGSLQSNALGNHRLSQLGNLTPGDYLLTVFTSKPNGSNDQQPQNDTIRFRFYVMGKAVTPLHESFESGTFPPDQWVLQQNGSGTTLQRTTASSSNGNASVFLNNFGQYLNGKTDNLISPIISGNSTYDSLFLSFDYAYAMGTNYPGASGIAEDTLEVKITTDCGTNLVSIFKSSGKNLITITDPEGRKSSPFIAGVNDWKSNRIYLTPLVGKGNFQVFFSVKGNKNGNNLYIDNIRVFGVIVPELLKKQGYLFYPSPFDNQFMVRHFEQPTSLRYIQVYNSTGQLIWQRNFNSNADKQISVNTSNWARGLYTVRLVYDDNHTVSERIVKQ